MRRDFAPSFSFSGRAFLAAIALSAPLALHLTLPAAGAESIGSEPAIKAEAPDSAKKNSRVHFAGLADYYHHSLYGKRTASGQVLKKDLLTAAHRTLPFGTRVHVLNKRTGKSCIVVINDRGPYTKTKIIDLSHAAADKLGLLQAGTGSVACTVLADNDE